MSTLPPVPDFDNPYAVSDSDATSQWSTEHIDDVRLPWLSVWIHPRRTIRSLAHQGSVDGTKLLVALYGIQNAMSRASNKDTGDQLSFAAVMAIVLVLGPLGGFVYWLISSYLIQRTGRWLGGTADVAAVRLANAWALVPIVAGLVTWLFILLINGSETFTSNTPRMDAEPWRAIPLIVGGGIQAILGIWSFILLCNTVAEVQGYRSAWRGLLNILLSGLVLLIPFAIVMIVLVALSSV